MAPLLAHLLHGTEGSGYLRLVSVPRAIPYSLPSDYRPRKGTGVELRPGSDGVIIGYGPILLPEAWHAANMLSASEGIELAVVNLPWLNRIDPDWLRAAVEGRRAVFTLDNHLVEGGQGRMIAAVDRRTRARGAATRPPLRALRFSRLRSERRGADRPWARCGEPRRGFPADPQPNSGGQALCLRSARVARAMGSLAWPNLRFASWAMHPVEPGVAYRRDIDGLRAVAVLAVVFFHADFAGFPGGFVGVDIFFVISGYLITSIIVKALEADRFSVAWFYERRIRRIIPALIALISVTAILSVAFLLPNKLISFGRSAVATAAFASNFFFAANTGYFAGPEKMMPLLHTWSLGVEEQFYIVWPLILLACHRLGLQRRIKILVVVLALASLACSEVATLKASTAKVGFFLPQTRAWELMIGAMLALGMAPELNSRWLREGLAALA